MTAVGVRELKNKLSEYIRRAEAGEVVQITVQGRAVAQLTPMPVGARRPGAGIEALVAAGLARAPLEKGPMLPHPPKWRFPKGTAARWLDEMRDESHER